MSQPKWPFEDEEAAAAGGGVHFQNLHSPLQTINIVLILVIGTVFKSIMCQSMEVVKSEVVRKFRSMFSEDD